MSFWSDSTGLNLDTTKGQYSSTPAGLISLIPGGQPLSMALTAASGNGPLGMQKPPLALPGMDDASKQQITDQENSSLRRPQDYQSAIMQGTGAAGSIQNQAGNQAAEQESQGGGGMPGMTQAIGDRAAKNFQTSKDRLNQKSQIEGMHMANQNTSTATDQAIALSAAQRGVDNQVNNYNLQSDQARYQVISSIMGGAGSIGGQMVYDQQAKQKKEQAAFDSDANELDSGFYEDSYNG